MIGFYDYTVVLTYASLVCSIFGMTQVFDGKLRTAILCLALSGLFDTFDGKIARAKKNRTNDQILFGVQIDSLCDMVCFGAFPAVICYVLGFKGIIGVLVIAYYCVCSAIRLGFFNVLETNRQMQEGGANKFYRGLPITSITIILPLIFLLNFIIPDTAFKWVLWATFIVVGTLFIINFKLRKPSNKLLSLLIIVVACAVAAILLFSRYHNKHIVIEENSLIEEIIE